MTTTPEIQRIAVVGAGAMGNGIAQVAASAGFDVILRDVTPEALDRGMGAIRKSLERVVKAGKLTATDYEATMARITATTEITACGAADYVIEAIPERLDLKKDMFRQLLFSIAPASRLLKFPTRLC